MKNALQLCKAFLLAVNSRELNYKRVFKMLDRLIS